MKNFRWWAFWRRMQYGIGYTLVVMLCLTGVYYNYFYEPGSCFDGAQNGDEMAPDCGGSCVRICSFTVAPPKVLWAESFAVTENQYNSVAYVENRNQLAGTPKIGYTFKLYDNDGLINEKSGTTTLPPNTTQPIFEGRIATGGRVPSYTTLELETVDLWLPGASDRSNYRTTALELLRADTRPRLNVTLQNDNLYAVNNVEVIATIFDAEGTPLTASQTFIDNFSGRSQSNLVFTWPLPIATTVRSCEVPTDVILAIDLSGSMNNLGGVPAEPLASVKKAAEAFVKRMGVKDRVAVVTFATDAELKVQLSSDLTTTATTISQLTIKPEEERGSTNSGEAFKLALAEFNSDRHNEDARKVLILLTDGLTNAPEPEPETYALTQVEALVDNNTQIYAIGLGADINQAFLQTIATDPNKMFTTLSPKQIDQIYRNITEDICEEGAARIDVVPKTGGGFPQWP